MGDDGTQDHKRQSEQREAEQRRREKGLPFSGPIIKNTKTNNSEKKKKSKNEVPLKYNPSAPSTDLQQKCCSRSMLPPLPPPTSPSTHACALWPLSRSRPHQQRPERPLEEHWRQPLLSPSSLSWGV